MRERREAAEQAELERRERMAEDGREYWRVREG